MFVWMFGMLRKVISILSFPTLHPHLPTLFVRPPGHAPAGGGGLLLVPLQARRGDTGPLHLRTGGFRWGFTHYTYAQVGLGGGSLITLTHRWALLVSIGVHCRGMVIGIC